MSSPIHIFSEIGKLKSVMLKRPGVEIENFTPDMMTRLLFDDIPYLPIAQAEHDEFAKLLQDHGAETLYVETLTAEAIDAGGVKEKFVDVMLDESGYTRGSIRDALKEYLLHFETQDMVDKIIAGREQWNDGSNTLAIAPGQVVTYNRNYVSNQLLRDHGLDVLEIASSELSRGRGGPRCMSMPLIREDI